MIDTHAHLFSCSDDAATLLARANAAGVSDIICVGLTIDTSIKSLEFSQSMPAIHPTIGLYPSEADRNPDVSKVEELAKRHLFNAIGEIGLDYVHNYATPKQQRDLLEAQLDIADRLDLPVIIHNRGADDDMICVFKCFPNVQKVFHCYSSPFAFADAQLAIQPNTYFSFTALICPSKKGKAISTLRQLPNHLIMVETDCPYLTPQAHKGSENEPAFVIEVAKKIAEIKQLSLSDVDTLTSENARRFFRI